MQQVLKARLSRTSDGELPEHEESKVDLLETTQLNPGKCSCC